MGLAQYVAGKIEEQSVRAGEVLILSPRRYFGYQIRDQLRALDVPAYSFFLEEELEGNPKDPDTSLAQQAYSLLNLLADPLDLVSLRCWCGFESSSLNRPGWERIRQVAAREGISPYEVLDRLSSGQLTLPYAGYALARFRTFIQRRDELTGLSGQHLIEALFPEADNWAGNLNRLAYQTAPVGCGPVELRDALLAAIPSPSFPRMSIMSV